MAGRTPKTFIGIKEFYSFIKEGNGENSPTESWPFAVCFYPDNDPGAFSSYERNAYIMNTISAKNYGNTFYTDGFFNQDNIENLRYCVQGITFPKIQISGSEKGTGLTTGHKDVSTIYGGYTILNNSYIHSAQHTLTINILSTQRPIIETFIYPWIKESVRSKYSGMPIPKLNMAVKYWMPNHLSNSDDMDLIKPDFIYYVTGLFPINMPTYSPKQVLSQSDGNRQVTFAFNDFIILNSEKEAEQYHLNQFFQGFTISELNEKRKSGASLESLKNESDKQQQVRDENEAKLKKLESLKEEMTNELNADMANKTKQIAELAIFENAKAQAAAELAAQLVRDAEKELQLAQKKSDDAIKQVDLAKEDKQIAEAKLAESKAQQSRLEKFISAQDSKEIKESDKLVAKMELEKINESIKKQENALKQKEEAIANAEKNADEKAKAYIGQQTDLEVKREESAEADKNALKSKETMLAAKEAAVEAAAREAQLKNDLLKNASESASANLALTLSQENKKAQVSAEVNEVLKKEDASAKMDKVSNELKNAENAENKNQMEKTKNIYKAETKARDAAKQTAEAEERLQSTKGKMSEAQQKATVETRKAEEKLASLNAALTAQKNDDFADEEEIQMIKEDIQDAENAVKAAKEKEAKAAIDNVKAKAETSKSLQQQKEDLKKLQDERIALQKEKEGKWFASGKAKVQEKIDQKDGEIAARKNAIKKMEEYRQTQFGITPK